MDDLRLSFQLEVDREDSIVAVNHRQCAIAQTVQFLDQYLDEVIFGLDEESGWIEGRIPCRISAVETPFGRRIDVFSSGDDDDPLQKIGRLSHLQGLVSYIYDHQFPKMHIVDMRLTGFYSSKPDRKTWRKIGCHLAEAILAANDDEYALISIVGRDVLVAFTDMSPDELCGFLLYVSDQMKRTLGEWIVLRVGIDEYEAGSDFFESFQRANTALLSAIEEDKEDVLFWSA